MYRIFARSLAAAALALVSSFGLVGVAHAATTCSYAGQASCLPATIDKSSVRAGARVTGTAGPVTAGEAGSIVLACPGASPVTVGSYVADGAGIINYSVVIPADTPAGSCSLNLAGHLPTGAAVTYFVPITIGDGSVSGGLPFTGAEIGLASALGVGLLGAGTMALIASRRRRSVATV